MDRKVGNSFWSAQEGGEKQKKKKKKKKKKKGFKTLGNLTCFA
jgi:hypothetical protein